MQINSANFAQTYQSIGHSQPTTNKVEPISPEQRNNAINSALDKHNELQQTQDQNQQQKRSAATSIIDHNQTQNNIETYTEAYQNATGNGSSSNSSNSLSYSDLQDINQSINRHQVANNSDTLSNIMDRRENEIATIYSPTGMQQQNQAGSVISAYA